MFVLSLSIQISLLIFHLPGQSLTEKRIQEHLSIAVVFFISFGYMYIELLCAKTFGVCQVYQFFRAAVTNYHKFCGLKQHQFITILKKLKMSVMRLKVLSASSFYMLKERLHFLVFSSFWRLSSFLSSSKCFPSPLLPLASVLTLPSSIVKSPFASLS